MLKMLNLNPMLSLRQHGFKIQQNGRYSFGGEMKRNYYIHITTHQIYHISQPHSPPKCLMLKMLNLNPMLSLRQHGFKIQQNGRYRNA
jgi:biotin operon repressor